MKKLIKGLEGKLEHRDKPVNAIPVRGPRWVECSVHSSPTEADIKKAAPKTANAYVLGRSDYYPGFPGRPSSYRVRVRFYKVR